MRAVASVDATPFHLVFAGGTCLARAHKLIRRMSEDVDFKIVPLNADAVSRSKRRKQLADLRDRVTAGVRAVGFPIDTADAAQLTTIGWRIPSRCTEPRNCRSNCGAARRNS